MISTNRYNYYFYIILSVLLVVLVFVANTLSISYKEALNVFVNTSILSYITNFSIYIFGQNDIALRLPFIIFYGLSVFFMYKMTEGYFKYERDRFISILIFMILPGVLSASLLVNSAIIATFFTLAYLYYYKIKNQHSYIFLSLLLFIDNSFSILFLALFFYSLKTKDKKLLLYSLILFSLSMYIYGFTTDGKPRGYMVDTFAIYASVFSPLLFIYFIYSIYRTAIKKEQDIVWYISTTALLLSFLFSLRQRVYIEDFAPYVVVSLPFMLKHFFHSYRVRLSEFRSKHKISAVLILSMLIINTIVTLVNKPLYLILADEKSHFAYKYHMAKDIAYELKKRNINYVNSDNKDLLLRLKFYDIKAGNDYYITEKRYINFDKEIKINYYGKDVLNLYIIRNNEKIF